MPNPPDPLPPPTLLLGCCNRDFFAKINAKSTLDLAIPMRPPRPRVLWSDLLKPPELLPKPCFERRRSFLWSKSLPSAHHLVSPTNWWFDLSTPPDPLPKPCFERCRTKKSTDSSAHQAPPIEAFGPSASNQDLKQPLSASVIILE